MPILKALKKYYPMICLDMLRGRPRHGAKHKFPKKKYCTLGAPSVNYVISQVKHNNRESLIQNL